MRIFLKKKINVNEIKKKKMKIKEYENFIRKEFEEKMFKIKESEGQRVKEIGESKKYITALVDENNEIKLTLKNHESHTIDHFKKVEGILQRFKKEIDEQSYRSKNVEKRLGKN